MKCLKCNRNFFNADLMPEALGCLWGGKDHPDYLAALAEWNQWNNSLCKCELNAIKFVTDNTPRYGKGFEHPDLCRITLNGEPVVWAWQADSVRGYVDVVSGFDDGNEIVQHRLFGVVTIEKL